MSKNEYTTVLLRKSTAEKLKGEAEKRHLSVSKLATILLDECLEVPA